MNDWQHIQRMLVRLNQQINWALDINNPHAFANAAAARNDVLQRLSRIAHAEVIPRLQLAMVTVG